MSNNPFVEYEKVFYKDAYRLMATCWNPEDPSGSVLKALKQAYEVLDGFIESLLAHAKKEGHKAAECHKGCAWCCYQPVFAGTHEIAYLMNYINKTFTDEQKASLKERIESKYEVSKDLSDAEALKLTHACPILVDGECSAYEARPIACRIYMSKSEAMCKKKFSDTIGENEHVPLLEFPLKAGRMLNEGIIACLKVNGYKVIEWRLEEGLVKLEKLV